MHVAAEGPLKTLIIIIVVAIVGLAGATFWTPYSAEYEVKTAAKVACNDQIRNLGWSGASDRWLTDFLKRARTAGVSLQPKQYSFEIQQGAVDNFCKVKIAWRSTTPIPLVGFVLDLPPLEYVHRVDFEHKVQKKY